GKRDGYCRVRGSAPDRTNPGKGTHMKPQELQFRIRTGTTGASRARALLALLASGAVALAAPAAASADLSFAPQSTVSVGSTAGSGATADLNADGPLDLVVVNEDVPPTVSVLLGNGDGTFQPRVTYAVGVNPAGLTIGDFNANGKPDVAVANTYTGDNSVSVLL